MIGSHVAWVFVALLLGVGIGWLTYKRGRARLLDASLWIILGLLIASPILLPGLPAAATPLGTLLALFYFIGCPLGWTWRHGDLVAHRCAETDAKGYVFRGGATPSRWQAFSKERGTHVEPAAADAPTVEVGGRPTASSANATAHAVPSEGKDISPSIAAASGANAGLAMAPLSSATGSEARKAPSPATSTLVRAPQAAATGGANVAPSAFDSPAAIDDLKRSALPMSVASENPPAPTPKSSALSSLTDEPTPVAASPSAPETMQTPPIEAAGSQQNQSTQTSLEFVPPPATDAAAGKVEPQTNPSAPTFDPPASSPVPDQHKHAGIRPPGFVNARDDKPDDLQLIRGIGPQNEGRLHGLGIWHFDQIGAWTTEEVRWVGSYLAFPGRIDREKWVEQARDIAAGAILPKAAARRPAGPR